MSRYATWLMNQPSVNSTFLMLALNEGGDEAHKQFLESQMCKSPRWIFGDTPNPEVRYEKPAGFWKFEEVNLNTLWYLGYCSGSAWNVVRTWLAERHARLEKVWQRKFFSCGRPLFVNSSQHHQLDDYPSVSRGTPTEYWEIKELYDGTITKGLRFERDNGVGRRTTSGLIYHPEVLAIYRRYHKRQPPFLVLREQSENTEPKFLLQHEKDLKFIQNASTAMNRYKEDWEKIKIQIDAGYEVILQQQKTMLEEILF
jgi:hypothetical protein